MLYKLPKFLLQQSNEIWLVQCIRPLVLQEIDRRLYLQLKQTEGNTGNKVANSAKLNDRSNSRCKTSFGNKNITCCNCCWRREKKPHELQEERTRESCMTRFITSCDQMSLPCTTTNCSVNRLQERQLLLTDRHLLQDTGSNES